MARPISDLTKFILSRPSELSVADVIAAADAQGLSASMSNVHRVRAKFEMRADGSVVSRGASKRKVAAEAPSAKATSATKRAGRGTRPAAAFVTRTSSAKTAHSPPTAVHKPGPDDTEKTMRAAVLAVVLGHGVDRARDVVDAVVAKLRAVVEAAERP
jgi:hypothetical protein